MSRNLPPVTIVVPAFNEEQFISGCLLSLLRGSYPLDKLEIIVVDDASLDGTCDRVRDLMKMYTQIKLFPNPSKYVSAALNFGVYKAAHETILWLGAHALYDDGYVVNSVTVLLDEDCASVGGVITPIAQSKMGNAIAIATVSKFGVGNAKYRNSQHRQSVDTVFGGCAKRANILKIGGFNESWVRNQDYEFNFRLRQLVGEIVLDPSIRCEYFCRESLSALAKQYFGYGHWRVQTLLKHPESFKYRQAMPLLLLFGLLLSLLAAPFYPNISIIVPAAYVLATLAVSISISLKQRNLSYSILLPAVFITIHLSWALGFSHGAIRHFEHLLRPSSGKA